MKSSDITILSSVAPLTIKEKPSKETVKILNAMLQSEDFALVMEKIGGIGLTNIIDIRKYIGSDITTIPLFKSEFLSILTNAYPETLLKSIGMSSDWTVQMALLMFCHAFIDIEDFNQSVSDPLEFVFGKKHIAARLHEYESQELGAILVPFNITKHRLKKWVDEKWDYIESKFNETLPDYLPINKTHKNFELGLTIVQLKDKEHLTFAQISTKLSDQNDVDKRLTDENFIKAVYYQEKFILEQLSKSLKRPFPLK